MAQSSFYGGRQGASFVIVERFDGINIPQDSENSYRTDYLAVTNDRQYFIFNNGFIYRNANNYTDYIWKRTLLDGSTVLAKENKEGTGETRSEVLDLVPAQGMVQCFSQGGATTDKVNYGEYVIIDTPNKDHPDNGKVFRRGMNYGYNPDTNPLAGGEYIGQIVGPKGNAPELDIDKYDNVTDLPAAARGTYTLEDGDLVPGTETDSIEYAFVTIRDEFGNITGSKIGFKIPYLVDDFFTVFRKPYYEPGDEIPQGKEVGDLLPEDFNIIERVDDESNPFYEKWKLHIPHGIKGESLYDLEIYPTLARKESIIYSDDTLETEASVATGLEAVDLDKYNPELNYLTVTYYDEVTLEEGDNPKELGLFEFNESEKSYILTNDEEPIEDKKYYSKETGYVNKADGWKEKIRYKLYNYENKEIGEYQYLTIGDYNIITDIDLEDDGTITISYTNDEDTVFENAIKWITSASLSDKGVLTINYNYGEPYIYESIKWIINMVLNNNGKFVVTFNTTHMEDDIEVHDTYEYDAIKWIDTINLAENGKFTVTFNTTHIEEGAEVNDKYIYESIKWVDSVELDDEGNFTMTFNTEDAHGDKDVYKYSGVRWIENISLTEDGNFVVTYNTVDDQGNPDTYEATLRTIVDAKINTRSSENADEGTGSQKVAVKYSNDEEYTEIGEALNYILDTFVVPLTVETGTWLPYKGHLLVYYSDPERRDNSGMGVGAIPFPSKRLGKNVDGWRDLGDLSREVKTPLSFGTYDTFQDIPALPPEIIMGSAQDPNYKYMGWGATYTKDGFKWVAQYNYLTNTWMEGIRFGDGLSTPSQVISMTSSGLENDGFYLETTLRKYAE